MIPQHIPATPSPPPDPYRAPGVTHVPGLHLLIRAAVWAGHHPWWPALLLLGLVAVATVGRVAVDNARHRRLTRHAQQVRIVPPPEVDPAGVITWWANLFEL